MFLAIEGTYKILHIMHMYDTNIFQNMSYDLSLQTIDKYVINSVIFNLKLPLKQSKFLKSNV